MTPQEEILLLEKRVKRERLARKEAERILEVKALELFKVNKSLSDLNSQLESENQRKEEDLRISQTKYKDLVEFATEVIYEADPLGNFTYVNPVTTQLLGYTLSEALKMNYLDVVREDFREHVQNYYFQCIDEEVEKSYIEAPVVTKSGKTVWIGQNAHFHFKEEGGINVFKGVSAVARDITETYKIRKELTLSEEKYRGIMENMELGFVEVDIEGKIVKAYDRFCEMSGYTNDELIGKDAKKLFAPPDYHDLMDSKDLSRTQGEISSYEVPFIKKSGERIWVLISGGPVVNEKGETIGSVGIHYDITHQKETEAELKKARDLAQKAQKAEKQFLANMSHEIRTPLNAIIGMSHLLYDTNPSKEQLEYLEMIKNSANFLHTLISDILDMAKIEAGRIELNETEFDLKNLLLTVKKTFQLKIGSKPIEIILDVDPSIKQFFIGDDTLLSQILLNIVGNAEKFTHQGSITIAAKELGIQEGKKLIQFSVKDTGVGMNKEQLCSIFEKFKQIPQRESSKTRGTGLGLAIVKELIQLQNGKIWVESEEDKGSSFFFELSYLPTNKTINNMNHERQGDENDFSNFKVLIAEDNTINLKYVTALMKKWSVDYSLAENGQVAIEKASNKKFDLILMDLQMPILNGYDATEQIRLASPKNKETPIVALTASAMTNEKQAALDIGMNDLLTKPFTPAQLLELLSSYFSKKRNLAGKSQKEINFDQKLLVETYGGDKDFQGIVFQSFIDDVEPQIQELKELYQQKDWESIASLAHKIKPAMGMVGFPSYQEDCKFIEQGLKQNEELGQIEKRLKGFLIDAPHIINKVKTELENLT